jgi:hypothetical protein
MNKNAIKGLRVSIKASSDTSRAIARQIQMLKFRTVDAAKRYRELQRAKGDHLVFRAERKALKRPETGPERYQLWNEKRGQGDVTRHQSLSVGFLRGVPYLTMERACDPRNQPSSRWIHEAIVEAFGQETCPYTQENVEAWLAGAVSAEVAAE